MPNNLPPPDPARFNLTSFADLLPERGHIIGEDLGSFVGFRDGMMQSLAPITPYEGLIAENLIAIEWELLQHRRMRDASLRAVIRGTVCEAVITREKAAHEVLLDGLFDEHENAGGTLDDWEEPFEFDEEAAEAAGQNLAERAMSRDPEDIATANAEIEAMGLNVVELMGEAYRSSGEGVRHHDDKIQELERRRREVKRDFDALQKTRPLEAEFIEG